MLAADVLAVLRGRLGSDGTAALVELLAQTIDERKPEMITAATERFERRMTEEISAVRVLLAQSEAGLRAQLAQSEAALRERLAQSEAGLRERLAQSEAGLREQLSQTESRLRQEIAASTGTIRQEIASGRVELFKWSFLFWIGQTLALAGFMAVMIRMARP
jgi:hypothetical protein